MDDEQLDGNDSTQTWLPEPPLEYDSDSADLYEDPREALGYPASRDTRGAAHGEHFEADTISESPPESRDVTARFSGVPTTRPVLEVVQGGVKEYCTKHTDQVIRPHYRTCPRCEGERNRKQVDAVAAVRRELKAGLIPAERERELVKQLYALDSLAGEFLKAIAEKRARGDVGSRARV